ncbi:MAG: DUF2975 domain-containing protein [Gammaproteobacteria bacterium]|nr:DUF2975 domain-containing protein [Gammaproteobacteria bacterium]
MTKPVMPRSLAIAGFVLRGLLILNWFYGAAILAGLVASLVAEAPVMAALGVLPSPDSQALIQGMRAVALLGIASVPLHYVLLRRLLEVVASVRERTPFVPENARRLHAIAWALLGLQVLSLLVAAVAEAVSTPAQPLHLDAGFSTGGWLAVLLLFVLARIFAEGTRLQDELEGTV